MNKLAVAVAILFSIALGVTAGYLYRDFQASPLIASLGTVAEVLRNQEAKSQVAYEAKQQELEGKQQELYTAVSDHKRQLANVHERWASSESRLKTALIENQRVVALAEIAPEPPTVVIPTDLTTLSNTACLESFELAAKWENLAIRRKAVIESQRVVIAEFRDSNKILTLQFDKAAGYRAVVEQQRNLWKKRYEEADSRVNKLKGSRLKWTAGVIAGVVIGFYATK